MNILKYTVLLSSVAFLAACSESSSSKKNISGENVNPESLSVVSSHLEKVTCNTSTTTKIRSLNSAADQVALNISQNSFELTEVEIKVEKLSDGKSERRLAKGTVSAKIFQVDNEKEAQEKLSAPENNFTYEATILRKKEKLPDGNIKTTDSTTTKTSLNADEERKSSFESITKKVGSEVITISEKTDNVDSTDASSKYRHFEIENGKEVITTMILVKPDLETSEDFQYETTMRIQTCIRTIQED